MLVAIRSQTSGAGSVVVVVGVASGANLWVVVPAVLAEAVGPDAPAANDGTVGPSPFVQSTL